eukprot:6657362-Prymnesium_polylepis.1
MSLVVGSSPTISFAISSSASTAAYACLIPLSSAAGSASSPSAFPLNMSASVPRAVGLLRISSRMLAFTCMRRAAASAAACASAFRLAEADCFDSGASSTMWSSTGQPHLAQ